MSNEIYHFKVGAFECTAVSDGTFAYAPPTFPPPATFLFVNAPKERLEQVLSEHKMEPGKWTSWTSPYICLLVNTGKQRVLVDTGADGLSPTTGKLVQNLRSQGIMPEDIDTIILTHAHGDHIGGNTDAGGKPVFSKARWFIWKDEWEFWTSEQAERKLGLDEHSRELLIRIARKNLLPLRSRVNLIDKEGEILPGIKAIAAPGHTPGHMSLNIFSRDEQLLCISDMALHPIHMEEPEWHALVDVVPRQVVSTRRRILERAAENKLLVIAFHFPFPGLGHIIRKGDAWQWQPVVSTGIK